MTCGFLTVLAQRPTVWTLQAVAPKDPADNPACSTTFSHPLEGQACLAPASKQQQSPLGITQAQGFVLWEASLQSSTSFPDIAGCLYSPLTH